MAVRVDLIISCMIIYLILEIRGYYAFHVYCTDPTLIYLVLVIGGYYAFHIYCMDFIPGPYLSAVHRYSSLFSCIVHPSTCIGVILRILKSFIPGLYLSIIHRYTSIASCIPSDTTFHLQPSLPTRLSTSHVPAAPAASLVAAPTTPSSQTPPLLSSSSFPSPLHHRAPSFPPSPPSQNNCVGESNLRFFLLFLFANICFLAYGVFGVCSILAGEITRSKVIAAIIEHDPSRTHILGWLPILLQWLTVYFHRQCALLLFFLVILVVLSCFLLYHLYLVATNVTTNEVILPPTPFPLPPSPPAV
ncbi:unnamed protein product [Closterium sp. NIES-64]|nr:unnamed protein product [Closterium sp. NIES-64]